MDIQKLQKDLIFFNPGKSGTVFTYKAGYAVDNRMIDQAIDHLQYETENQVECVEERRGAPREM
jgi:hypothetical protein